MKNAKALVVLSGGQDSTTCLALARKAYQEVHCITFDYGQRHSRELQAAAAVAVLAGSASHETITIGDGILKGTSPLTDKTAELEQYDDFASMDKIIGERIEKTFVPMRNALFLTIAANRAVVLGCEAIYTGVCEADNANYPDCRQSFVESQETTIQQALGVGGPHIETPLIHASKAQSIGLMLHIDALWLLAFTHTAYDGQYPPLGKDHATLLRAEGFRRAGIPDPLLVRAAMEGLVEWADVPGVGGTWAKGRERMIQLHAKIDAGRNALQSAGIAL